MPNAIWLEVRDFVFCSGGFLISYSFYSYYQEFCMTTVFYNSEYPEGERYISSSFSTTLNRIFTLALSLLICGAVRLGACYGWFGGPDRSPDRVPIWEYAIGAYANNIASVAQYSSIHFISFPLLVLSKVCKMVPVMLVNWIVYRRGYTSVEWTLAFVVMIGALLFILYDEDTAIDSSTAATAGGIGLLILFLFADAYTASWQGATYRAKSGILPMLIWLNVWAVAISFVSSVTTPDLSEAIAFCNRNPGFIGQLCVLSATSAIGQVFILITISRFGPLTYAAVATLRQLLSALISIETFHHYVQFVQILGLLLVFSALGSITRLRFYNRSRKRREGEAAASSTDGEPPGSAAAAGPDLSASLLSDEKKSDSSANSEYGEGELARAIAAAEADAHLEKDAEWLACGLDVRKLVPCVESKAQAMTWLTLTFLFVAGILRHFLTVSNLSKLSYQDDDGVLKTESIAYSAISCAVSILLTTTTFIFDPNHFGAPERKSWPVFICVCFASAVDMSLSNVAIAELSPALQQSLKAMQPVVVVIMETVLRCERKQLLIYIAAALMATGTVFTAVADEPPHCPTTATTCTNEDGSLFVPFPVTWPIIAQCIAITSSALKYVLLREASRNMKTRLYPVAMLFWVDVIIFIILMPFALVFGQFEALISQLQSAENPALLSWWLFLACSAGGIYFFTELLALRRVDAIDVSATSSLISLVYIILQLIINPEYNQGEPTVLNDNITSLPPTRDDAGHTATYNATESVNVLRPGWNMAYLITGICISFFAIFGYIAAVRHYSKTGTVVVERSECADKYAVRVDNLCGITEACCLKDDKDDTCCAPRRKPKEPETPAQEDLIEKIL